MGPLDAGEYEDRVQGAVPFPRVMMQGNGPMDVPDARKSKELEYYRGSCLESLKIGKPTQPWSVWQSQFASIEAFCSVLMHGSSTWTLSMIAFTQQAKDCN